MKNFLLGLGVSILVLFSAIGGAIADRLFVIRPLDYVLGLGVGGFRLPDGKDNLVTQKILKEEGVVVEVVERASPSVVTIASVSEEGTSEITFGPFGMMNVPEGEMSLVQHDIATGFVIEGGLVITNKHVVVDREVTYKVIGEDDKEYVVEKIYRDPLNDLAILQIEGGEDLSPLELGDSNQLKAGQFVIAIGTALGEFRQTVTTGVISGLGRGITAGDVFNSERLDNVIQTDAAINLGNSGGPLLNSAGQVIGINVAVSGNGQNIGFAIPINELKTSLDNFETTGRFSRPFLGVRYRMINQETAILNDVPQGAYVEAVLKTSPAAKAKIRLGDILLEADGKELKDVEDGLVSIINQKKVGEILEMKLWREGKEIEVKAVLEESED